MESLFLKLVNMSITASWLVLAVLMLRVVLKNTPKYIRCILWCFVGLRLIFPFSIESVLSLVPSSEPLPQEFLYAASPQINTGIPALNDTINPIVSGSLTPQGLTSANPTQIWSAVFARLWLIGVAAIVLYAVVSYLLVRRKVAASIKVGTNIRLCDHIESPFILGIFRPQIYLPSNLDQSTADHVLAHEYAHLKRKDHWWKPLGFALLSVYWFNPVMWLAYILLCRDIELACDEKVIRDLGPAEKKAYSSALLRCSVPRRMIAACPLAFGEVGVKDRIKSVLNYKKPAFWVIVVAIIVCVIVAVCFLTDPVGVPFADITPGAYREVESITVIKDDRSYEITTRAGIEQVMQFLSELTVDKKEISKSRSEDRDKTNSIILHCVNGVERSYHFNAYCTEVWYNDSVKPTMTYSVNGWMFVRQFFSSTIEAAAEMRLDEGVYIPVECLYMNMFSSYAPINIANEWRYEVTEDGFVEYYLPTGSSSPTAVTWQWKTMAEAAEELEFFNEWLEQAPEEWLPEGYEIPIGSLEGALYQKLDEGLHLLKLQNGDLLLIDGQDRTHTMENVWSIYRLESEETTAIAGSEIITVQDGYIIKLSNMEHHSNAVSLLAEITFPESVFLLNGNHNAIPEDICLLYTSEHGKEVVISNHTGTEEIDEEKRTITYRFVFNLDSRAPTENSFTLSIGGFRVYTAAGDRMELTEKLTASWRADVDAARTFRYEDGDAQITMTISPLVINITAYRTGIESVDELNDAIKILDWNGNLFSLTGGYGGSAGSSLISYSQILHKAIDVDSIETVMIGDYVLESDGQPVTKPESSIVTQYPDSIAAVWKEGRESAVSALFRSESMISYRSLDTLDAAIYDAVTSNNVPEDWGDSAWLESHVILSELVACGLTEDGSFLGQTVVDVLAQVCEVQETDGEIEIISTRLIPVVISFDVTENHSYKVADFWQGEENTDLTEAMNEKFSPVALENIRPIDEYVQEFYEDIRNQAVYYFDLLPRPSVESFFTTIIEEEPPLSINCRNDGELSNSFDAWNSDSAMEHAESLLDFTFEDISENATEEDIWDDENCIMIHYDGDGEDWHMVFKDKNEVQLWHRNKVRCFRAIPQNGENASITDIARAWYSEAEEAYK